jgi:hypothetical protein
MTKQSQVGDRIIYGRRLMHAGVDALRTKDKATADYAPALAQSARAAFGAAAVGIGFGFLGYGVVHLRKRHVPRILACGAVAFCANFLWRTRGIGADLTHRASREIAKVRDQRWLELHPIDYA